MPANIDPIYSKAGRIGNGGTSTTFRVSTSTANTNLDGTGTLDTDIWSAFTADSTNGSFLRSIVIKMRSGSGTSTATVIRFFINNGSSNGTNTNNALYREISIPALTGSQTAANPDFEIPCNLILPAGYRILYTFGTAPTNLFMVFGVGGDY